MTKIKNEQNIRGRARQWKLLDWLPSFFHSRKNMQEIQSRMDDRTNEALRTMDQMLADFPHVRKQSLEDALDISYLGPEVERHVTNVGQQLRDTITTMEEARHSCEHGKT